MEKITLYEFENTEIKISMKVYFNEDTLIFDGYDIGKIVNKLTGDSDYEYQYSVEYNEVKKLATLFDIDINNRIALLNEIKNRFNKNDAYSKFGAFMNDNNIAFESFIWR